MSQQVAARGIEAHVSEKGHGGQPPILKSISIFFRYLTREEKGRKRESKLLRKG